MKIWKQAFTLDGINALSGGSMTSHIGIEFTDFGEDYLQASMPVDHRTTQPMGLLHGGANAVLAETLGSVASALCLEDLEHKNVVGLELNVSHLRATTEGKVTGTVRPVRIGRKVHVWHISISREDGKEACVGRLTVAITDRAS